MFKLFFLVHRAVFNDTSIAFNDTSFCFFREVSLIVNTYVSVIYYDISGEK